MNISSLHNDILNIITNIKDYCNIDMSKLDMRIQIRRHIYSRYTYTFTLHIKLLFTVKALSFHAITQNNGTQNNISIIQYLMNLSSPFERIRQENALIFID